MIKRYRIVMNGGPKGIRNFTSSGSFGTRKGAYKQATKIRNLRKASNVPYKSVRVISYYVGGGKK